MGGNLPHHTSQLSPKIDAHAAPAEQRAGSEKPAAGEPLSYSAMLFALIVLLPVAGAVLGVMAINQSSIANDQSQVANQIALLSMCYGNSVRHSFSLSNFLLLRNIPGGLITPSPQTFAKNCSARPTLLFRHWQGSCSRLARRRASQALPFERVRVAGPFWLRLWLHFGYSWACPCSLPSGTRSSLFGAGDGLAKHIRTRRCALLHPASRRAVKWGAVFFLLPNEAAFPVLNVNCGLHLLVVKETGRRLTSCAIEGQFQTAGAIYCHLRSHAHL